MSRLDFNNPADVREWLTGLRTDLNQADGASRDMLRPKRKRELGHALHRDLYKEAWRGIVKAMEAAGFPLDDGDSDKPPTSRRVPRTPKPEGDGGDGGDGGDDGPKGAA